ncbi:MAG: outer membrane beta-barrel protein, partial [Bacteroidota bacterium]
MIRFVTLILLTFILGIDQLNAQGFKAHIALGTNIADDNLTELGNSQVGTRLGVVIGPGVSGLISSRWEMGVELLFSQNGHYVKHSQLPTIGLDKIRLDYLEVPVTLAYR